MQKTRSWSAWSSLLVSLLTAAWVAGSSSAFAAQSPLGCSANNLNVNIGVRANNVTNGTLIVWTVTVQNPTDPTSCDVTLGTQGLFFTYPGLDGRPTGGTTNLIAGGTTIAPGFGPVTFEIPWVVRVNPGVRTAQAMVSAPGSVVHKNPLQDDPADVDKSISVNIFQPCIVVGNQCLTAVNPNGNEVTVTYRGSVTNCGNVLLQNVMVHSDQPGLGTMVFGPITLPAGASTNFTASYTTTANLCGPFVQTLVASGEAPLDTVVLVASSASSQCAIGYTPAIRVTKECPAAPVPPGGTLAISGVVSNAGNIVLTNVIVVDSVLGPNAPLLGPITLPVGAAVPYSGSYTVPLDSCGPYSDTVTASGTSTCGGQPVTSSATTSCPGINSPAISVVVNCPDTPVAPGGRLNYSGTVVNTGNITLTDVIVTSDRPNTNRIFGPITLAPGAFTNFTAGYNVPADSCGPYTHTVVASGRDKCFGVTVSQFATAICPGTTSPGIEVTRTCPTAPVQPGGTLAYSGTVANTGNITLRDVTVVSDQPAPNTVVYGPATLAPGARANYNASYTVPLDSCGPYVGTVVARGSSSCGADVQDTETVSCAGTNTPSIRVTKVCPPNPVQPGEVLTYTGTVTNTGNVTLNNVTVVNTTQPAANTVVFGPVTLAPGAGATFSGSYTVPLDSCGPYTDSVTASGADQCYGRVVTSSASTSCPGANAPGIVVLEACPDNPAPIGGRLAYTGTVINSGNITLTNVAVVSSRGTSGANETVFRVAQLAPNESVVFTNSFAVPANLNACSITNTLNVTARVKCNGVTVTNAVTTVCPVDSAPGIRVLNLCPTTAPATGGTLTYTGIITNVGNVALANIVVMNTTASGSTVAFTTNSLGVGRSFRFTGSYVTPADSCSSTHTLSVTADSLCGNVVSDSASATCPLATTRGLAIDRSCPPAPVRRGTELVFTGWITNTGNVTLTNVSIVVDRPAPNTRFFGTESLAPGQAAGFVGSFIVPTNVTGCSISSTLQATGFDQCTGQAASISSTFSCPVIGNPQIIVTKNCPPAPVAPGGTFTFSGTVLNAGDVTLTNVVVTGGLCNQPELNTPVFRIATLNPGQSANFNGSYVVPGNCCTVTDTLLAQASDNCAGVLVSDTSTTVCPVLFTARVRITKTCPTEAVLTGELLKYSGVVSNAGNVTLTDLIVYNSVEGINNPILGVFNLAPGEAIPFTSEYNVPSDFCGTDTVAVQATSLCGGTVTDSVTSTCPVTTSPAIAVTRNCPSEPILHATLTSFTATVVNIGNVTLTNVVVRNSMPTNNTLVFGPATLAPGQATNFVYSYVTPADCNCCELVDTLTARGQDQCGGRTVTATSTSVCDYQTNPRLLVTMSCSAAGDRVNYSGMVMNNGDITLTNVIATSNETTEGKRLVGPIVLAPGEMQDFSGSYLVSATSVPLSALVVTAVGTDMCKGTVVTANDNCLGNLLVTRPIIAPLEMDAEKITITWSAVPGITYRVQSATDLEGEWESDPRDVVAEGETASKIMPRDAAQHRFYRVLVAP